MRSEAYSPMDAEPRVSAVNLDIYYSTAQC